jgi:arginase
MDPDLTSCEQELQLKRLRPKKPTKSLNVISQKNEKTVCIEFVEVNPCLMRKINKMAEVTMTLPISIKYFK